MTEQRAKGIILRRRNVGEADRLYSILTLGKGKVTAKARGVRRVTSKQSGHLEPFYLTSFHLVSTHGTEIITQAHVEESFPGIHADLGKIGLAARLAELVDKLTEEHQPVPRVFDLLLEAFQIVEKTAGLPPSLFVRTFELKLMGALGYRPELSQCVVGEEKYSALQSYHFSVSLGGIVCPDHQKRFPGNPISKSAIQAMRTILDSPLAEGEKAVGDQETAREVDRLVREFLAYHLDPKLKSPKVEQDLQR